MHQREPSLNVNFLKFRIVLQICLIQRHGTFNILPVPEILEAILSKIIT